LYDDPEKIYKRKRERNPKSLRKQMNKFKGEIKHFYPNAKFIKTKNENQTLKDILKELNCKRFLCRL
jgi:hypothetical protein